MLGRFFVIFARATVPCVFPGELLQLDEAVHAVVQTHHIFYLNQLAYVHDTWLWVKFQFELLSAIN